MSVNDRQWLSHRSTVDCISRLSGPVRLLVRCTMHVICYFMPISASTELTQLLYFAPQKDTAHLFSFRPSSAGARGHMLPAPYPPPPEGVD